MSKSHLSNDGNVSCPTCSHALTVMELVWLDSAKPVDEGVVISACVRCLGLVMCRGSYQTGESGSCYEYCEDDFFVHEDVRLCSWGDAASHRRTARGTACMAFGMAN